MKTAFYIFGPIAFTAFILINQPVPEEPTPEFQSMKKEMYIKEATLNQKIIEVENQLCETRVLVQEEFSKK